MAFDHERAVKLLSETSVRLFFGDNEIDVESSIKKKKDCSLFYLLNQYNYM